MLKLIYLFDELFLKSWWVLLFLILCYMLYEQGMRKRDVDFRRLSTELEDLRKEKNLSLEIQEDLLLQINSQSDPAWVELTLMKGLGLVPEGQTKIYFNRQQ